MISEAAGFSYAGTFVGADAIAANVFRRLGTEWDSYTAEPDLVIGDGDQVAARGWYSGTYKQTGKPFRACFVHERAYHLTCALSARPGR